MKNDLRKPRRALCYISGPISHPVALQRVEFRLAGAKASAELWERDVLHFCPMVAMPPVGHSDLEYEDWMTHDIEILRRADFVLMLPGWEASRGACREHAVALELGLPIVFDPDAAADMAREIEAHLEEGNLA